MGLDDSNQILSKHLNRLLESTDVSRLDLSRRMGVADGTLGRIKYGRGNPTLDVVDRIARYFRVDPWALLKPASERDVDAQPPVDITLLSSCLTRAMALFREEQRLPTDHQVATVAGYLYSCAAHQRNLTNAEAEVRAMLGQLSQADLQLKEPADAR